MSSYAVLGGTGQVGSKILQLLLKEPKNEVHVYVRSKSKLLKAQPAIEEYSQVKIFEGDIQDVGLIKDCIANTKAVFMTAALSENLPGCTIAVDSAKVVVKALEELKSQNLGFRFPKIIVLSSASTNDKFWKGVPSFVHNTMFNANYYIYSDLQEAERYLRDQKDWLTCTFMKPGGLVEDVQHGYKLDPEECYTFMSFTDLAAAMIEIADTKSDRWEMKDVSIVPETVGARLEYKAPYILAKGLISCFFPKLYMYLRAWLP